MDRLIRLEGCANFRDAGGYPARGGRVRWRRLFRSAALHELTPDDVRRLRDELGVTTVVDLRSDDEREGDIGRPFAGTGVELVHAALVGATGARRTAPPAPAPDQPGPAASLARGYAALLERAGAVVNEAVRAVAGSPGAVVVHCAAGKDRTGIIVGMVLGCLGVADHDIAADYALTAGDLAAVEERLRRHGAYARFYRDLPPHARTADAATMHELLADLKRRYTSVSDAMTRFGVARETIERLRATLIVPE